MLHTPWIDAGLYGKPTSGLHIENRTFLSQLEHTQFTCFGLSKRIKTYYVLITLLCFDMATIICARIEEEQCNSVVTMFHNYFFFHSKMH